MTPTADDLLRALIRTQERLFDGPFKCPEHKEADNDNDA